MQTLARLFGSSPFVLLQAHMDMVSECIKMLPHLFKALRDQDTNTIANITTSISSLEHNADCIKNDIRNHLPAGVMLPISIASLLEILSIQDSLADAAEDVAVILSFRIPKFHPEFESIFFTFLNKNLEAFEHVRKIVFDLDTLLESSFGGASAKSAKDDIHKVAVLEHETDVIQRDLMHILFDDKIGDMSYKDFILWIKIIKGLAFISNSSEKLANRICMILSS